MPLTPTDEEDLKLPVHTDAGTLWISVYTLLLMSSLLLCTHYISLASNLIELLSCLSVCLPEAQAAEQEVIKQTNEIAMLQKADDTETDTEPAPGRCTTCTYDDTHATEPMLSISVQCFPSDVKIFIFSCDLRCSPKTKTGNWTDCW